MDLQLEGRTALVTGASSGIGVGIAKRLAREGVHVCVHGRNQLGIDQTVEAILADGGRASGVTGDFIDEQATARVADGALAALGGQIDILVANAGGRARKHDGGWPGTTPQDWADTFQVNVNSTVQLVQALAPAMMERGFGRIIVIASVAGISPPPGTPDYAAAKAALLNMVVSGAKWLKASGVTINAISPGAVLTPGMEGHLELTAKARGWEGDLEALERQAVKQMFKIPVGRMGRIDEIAASVAMLASPLGGFYQGANLRIDGGALGAVGG